MATSGYSAAIETNATVLSYGLETAWGTLPAVQFQAIRYTSETLAGATTRQRPSEITNSREAAQAVTTQVTAGGTVNFALSYGTFDDFIANTLQAPWEDPIAIDGSTGDITITQNSPGVTLSSTTSSKFQDLTPRRWIKLMGFAGGANGYWFITAKASDQSITITGPKAATATTETPTGSAAKIRSSSVKNGATFQSMYIQQKFSSDKFQVFPGAYPSRMTFSGQLGNYTTGSVDIVARSETTVTSDQSTGAVLAAPGGRVMDPVQGFAGVFIDEAEMTVGIDQFTLTLENTGSASEFAMGSASAQGILTGTFTATGSFRCYFQDFTYYDIYRNAQQVRIAFLVQDPDGNAYAFTFLAAVLNGRLTVGGPGQPVYAEFDIEGGPDGTNGTFVVDRMAGS